MATPEPSQKHLIRGFGLLEAAALNMSNMVGVGPFLTIPLIIASMGGPQCMLGWLIGVLIALSDGLIWAELAAAMPASGGTFYYFRRIFEGTRLGRLLPFLFVWQFIFSGPLEVASGFIGFAQYLSYFWRGMPPWGAKAVAAGAGILVVALLYRQITAVARLTVVLWVGMLITVLAVIVSGLFHFDPALAFDFPPNAFQFSMGFLLGLGGATQIAMYDFLGYYDICYVGGEVRQPARVIPRAILISVIAVALIYSVMNLSIIGVVPWREAMQSPYIAAEFMERLFGPWAGGAITVLILWTALASVFALMLGYSRIPYAAAEEGFFFPVFARLHPTGKFPHISLLVMGALSIAAASFPLDQVIAALLTTRILVQFLGQAAAVVYWRRYRPEIERPFRMWLYPLPVLIASVGWLYVFGTAGGEAILYGLLTLGAGVVAWAVWERFRSPA